MQRTLTHRGRQFAYALGVARAYGRVTEDVISRIMHLVASGGLDNLPLEEEGVERMGDAEKRWPLPPEELVRMRDQGLSVREIARRCGVSDVTVGKTLKKLARAELPPLVQAIAILLQHGASVDVQVQITLAHGSGGLAGQRGDAAGPP